MVLIAGGEAAGAAEFMVNQYTLYGQYNPAISRDSSGGFVLAWHSLGQDGSSEAVLARRFSSSGTPIGGEFLVNQYTISFQKFPTIAHNSSGGFVIVWQSFRQDGFGIFGRRFDSSGAPAGAEFQVNGYTTGTQDLPAIAPDASGGFIAAWRSDGQDGAALGVFARRFDSSGSAVGADFQVNQYTTGNQGSPTLSYDPAGGFVVAWESSGQDGSGGGVFRRRFDSSGNPRDDELQVNQVTTGAQSSPRIAPDSSGGFVVVWQSDGQDGSLRAVFARRFDSSGAALGAEFQLNQFTTSSQQNPTISQDASGGFTVAWQSFGQDGSNYAVFGRRFDSSGAALGAEFQLNQYTTSSQHRPAISPDPSGGFVVAWQSLGQDGSSYGVFARRVPRPSVSIDDAMVSEGQTDSNSASFMVQLSEPPELGPLDLDYATADGTASAGSDYTATSGTLSIPAGQTMGEVTVPVLGDTLYEADETFAVNLTTTGLADLVDPAAVGLIVNDDAPPSLAIGDLQVAEGNAGTSEAQFAVTISQASGLPARVDFSTSNGTAIAGEDYSAASGMLLFPAMSTAAQTAVVMIHGDLDFEPDETFSVALANPVDATVADGLAVGTILNDDGNFLIATGAAAGGASLVRRYQGD